MCADSYPLENAVIPEDALSGPSASDPQDRELVAESIHFHCHFAGCMEMYGDRATVAAYLSHHEGWFRRCAQPMQAEPFGDKGYILTVGRFGSLGYEVEPKMAVVFDMPEEGFYPMYSVPIPNYTPPGYNLDYQAHMHLQEVPCQEAAPGLEKAFQRFGNQCPPPARITQVLWELHLNVWVQFPKFIYRLPHALLEKSGNALLGQIVKQVSPRLTYKVQKDFHDHHQLPLPPRGGRGFRKLKEEEVDPQYLMDSAPSMAPSDRRLGASKN